MMLFNGAIHSGGKTECEVLLYDGLNKNHINCCEIFTNDQEAAGGDILDKYNEMRDYLSDKMEENDNVQQHIESVFEHLTSKNKNNFKNILELFISDYKIDQSVAYQEADAITENSSIFFIDFCNKNSNLSEAFKKESIKNILVFLENNPEKKGSIRFFDNKNKVVYSMGFDKQNKTHYLIMSDGRCGEFQPSLLDDIINSLLKEELNIVGGYLKT